MKQTMILGIATVLLWGVSCNSPSEPDEKKEPKIEKTDETLFKVVAEIPFSKKELGALLCSGDFTYVRMGEIEGKRRKTSGCEYETPRLEVGFVRCGPSDQTNPGLKDFEN